MPAVNFSRALSACVEHGTFESKHRRHA
jgi:hypothetical protein